MSEENNPLRIYVGWDSKEEEAYEVCRQSIIDHASVPVEIIPLKQKFLRKTEVYTRPNDNLSSTEFTFTRFLVPHLSQYSGWALFIDCDFVFLDDPAKLFEQSNNDYAVMCAHHDYTPKEGLKMDGKQQYNYPRKNWSSCMLINCGHPANRQLTTGLVNNRTKTGAFFHRFSWLDDSLVGEISHEWNWLVGWYKEPEDGTPKALHYTEGGPWFKEYEDCEYNYEYYKVKQKLLQSKLDFYENVDIVGVDRLTVNPNKKIIIDLLLKSIIDPEENIYKTKDELNRLKEIEMGVKVLAVSKNKEDGEANRDYRDKGAYDPFLQDFVIGSGGTIGLWDYKNKEDTALVIRGLGGKAQKALKICIESNREFYAIDTGYMQPSIRKDYHRITKNGLQNTSSLITRPDDRLSRLNVEFGRHKTGSKILICPPSGKVMKFYDQDLDVWIENTIAEIKKYTDRPIEIRTKPVARSTRTTTDTIYNAMANDVHCLVTYNSIAATEAFLFGLPAIALATNAATSVCNTAIDQIDNLIVPTEDLQVALARHLSYCQFTPAEIRTGYAWEILNESS